jgi:hypothetical protein
VRRPDNLIAICEPVVLMWEHGRLTTLQASTACYRDSFLNLGCLHPVARVISYDVGFDPSTQRHYRRLIYYLYIHSYMFRSYDHFSA